MASISAALNEISWGFTLRKLERGACISRNDVLVGTRFAVAYHTNKYGWYLYIPIFASVSGMFFLHSGVCGVLGVGYLALLLACPQKLLQMSLYVFPKRFILAGLTTEYIERLFWRYLVQENPDIKFLIQHVMRYNPNIDCDEFKSIILAQAASFKLSGKFVDELLIVVSADGALEVQYKQRLTKVAF